MNGKPAVGSTTAIFDTGTTQILSDPTSIANFFEQISGAEAAPQFGEGIYTSVFSGTTNHPTLIYLQYPSSLHVRHPHLY